MNRNRRMQVFYKIYSPHHSSCDRGHYFQGQQWQKLWSFSVFSYNGVSKRPISIYALGIFAGILDPKPDTQISWMFYKLPSSLY